MTSIPASESLFQILTIEIWSSKKDRLTIPLSIGHSDITMSFNQAKVTMTHMTHMTRSFCHVLGSRVAKSPLVDRIGEGHKDPWRGPGGSDIGTEFAADQGRFLDILKVPVSLKPQGYWGVAAWEGLNFTNQRALQQSLQAMISR